MYFLLMIFFLSPASFIYAQGKPLVKKTYAYFFIDSSNSFPKNGTEDIIPIQTDSSYLPSKPASLLPVKIDTSIIVVIETSTPFILWETAVQNKQCFIVTTIPVKTFPFNSGFLKSGKEIMITPAKGNFLFVLQFSKQGNKIILPLTTAPIVLKGKYKGKFITWKTATLKEIVPLPRS